MSEAAPELSLEEKKAAKRTEIEEKLAGLKLQQEKEASQKTMYFGEHPGITCDACGSCPMVGYRYKCKQAPAANTLAQHPFRRLPACRAARHALRARRHAAPLPCALAP